MSKKHHLGRSVSNMIHSVNDDEEDENEEDNNDFVSRYSEASDHKVSDKDDDDQ